jgi:hypothetical protein
MGSGGRNSFLTGGFKPKTGWANQALSQNLRYTDGIAQGMMTRSPNDACGTHTVEAAIIAKDATSVLKGLAQRRSKVS